MAFVLAILALAAASSARAGEPARFALVIGNQSYASAVGPLKNPKNDIALIKSALLKVGFSEADIAVVSDADRVAMLEAFEAFAARVGRAGPDAISFFYYSGHGAANERRDNFLIPIWGDAVGKNRANCDGCGSQWDNWQTAPVGSFPPNAYGLFDMHGNVSQWVQDCYTNNYGGPPLDWSVFGGPHSCAYRAARGGSWTVKPELVRAAARGNGYPYDRTPYIGFRVARTLN